MTTASAACRRFTNRGTGRLRNIASLATAALLASLALVAVGCSPKPESMADRFPTLVAHAGWNEAKLNAYVNATATATSSLYPISGETLPSMPVGAQIDVTGSRYSVSSIFDIWLLHKNGLLDQDASRSAQESTIKMTTNSAASSTSTRQDKSQGFSLGGLFKKVLFKASYQHQSDTAAQNLTQDGDSYLSLDQTVWGNTLGILTSGAGARYDLRQYLLGPQLTADQVASWVSPQMAEGSQGPYISDVFLQSDGIYTGSSGGPHAFVDLQLLNAMETLFGQALTQYSAYGTPCVAAKATDCAAVQAALYGNMVTLKAAVAGAITRFYLNYGDGFASRIEGINEAIAIGTTSYYSSSSNSETSTSWGLSMSLKFAAKGGLFGGGGSGGKGTYNEEGNAEAWSLMDVTATCKPAGIVDTSGWAADVGKSLAAVTTTNKVTVPDITVPKVTALTPPDFVGDLKDPDAPPDNCFQSYDQWKAYQADQKAQAEAKPGVAQQGNPQINNQLQQVVQQFELQPFQEGINGNDEDGLGASPGLGQPTANRNRVLLQPASATVHAAIVREFAELRKLRQERARKGAATAAATDFPLNNVVRIPDMYTAGFDFTSYAEVFPELRPQLDLPAGQLSQFAGFPNAIRLMLGVDQVGALRSYIRFLSNYGASNVTPDIVTAMEAMYQAYSDATFATLEPAMTAGADVTRTARASFATAMFGTRTDMSDGALYQAVGNPDVFSYLYHLLDPAPKSIWMKSPGGYLPFVFDGNGQLAFYEATGSNFGTYIFSGGQAIAHHTALATVFHPVIKGTTRPLDFYGQTTYPQSTLYPVFAYLGSRGMNLLFLQTIGSYQVIYGRNYGSLPITAPLSEPLRVNTNSCAPAYLDATGLNLANVSVDHTWSWTPNAQAWACNNSTGGPIWSNLPYPTATMWETGNSFLGKGITSAPPYSTLPSELSWEFYLPWPETSQPVQFKALTLGFDPVPALANDENGAEATRFIIAGFGQSYFYGQQFNLTPHPLVKVPTPVINAFTGPDSAAPGQSITLAWDVSYATTVMLTDYCNNETHTVTSGALATTVSMGNAGSCQFRLTARGALFPTVPQVQQDVWVNRPSQSPPATGAARSTVGLRGRGPSRAATSTTWVSVDLGGQQPLQSTTGVRLMLLPVNETTVPGWGSIVYTNHASLNYLPEAPFGALIRDATPTVPGTFDDVYNRALLGTNIDCSAATGSPNCQVRW